DLHAADRPLHLVGLPRDARQGDRRADSRQRPHRLLKELAHVVLRLDAGCRLRGAAGDPQRDVGRERGSPPRGRRGRRRWSPAVSTTMPPAPSRIRLPSLAVALAIMVGGTAYPPLMADSAGQ